MLIIKSTKLLRRWINKELLSPKEFKVKKFEENFFLATGEDYGKILDMKMGRLTQLNKCELF